MPTRADALAILDEHTKTDSLMRHGLTVEAVMRSAAARVGGSPDLWGTAVPPGERPDQRALAMVDVSSGPHPVSPVTWQARKPPPRPRVATCPPRGGRTVHR